MQRRPLAIASLIGLLAGFFLATPVATDSARREGRVAVEIGYPADGTMLANPLRVAYIAGHAFTGLGELQAFDLFFVIDSSKSTNRPSGMDVDGDGRAGKRILRLLNTDSDDSILAAEIAAADRLLNQLDPRSTWVGVVSFGGARSRLWGLAKSRKSDAVLEQPLTSDYALVREALARILVRGPSGGTNMAEGIQLATGELVGFRSMSQPRLGAQRIQLLLTDGFPTLPFRSARHAERENIEFAVNSARISRIGKIRIDTFALGEKALSRPVAAVEIARVTEGNFTPVVRPSDLVFLFDGMSLVDIESLEVTNLTVGKKAEMTVLNADGSFDAIVPVSPGVNRIRALATATNGRIGWDEILVHYAAGPEEGLALDVDRLERRNRLLELKLDRIREENRELEAAKERRKALEIEIQREKEKAVRRTEEQKRELEIED